MTIGKLVESNSHTDYICQVYGHGEVEAPSSLADYAFGTFFYIPLDEGYGHLVGLIYDTVLLNPDFGSLGPCLSPVPDLAAFLPDYLAEKVTLVGIIAAGMLAPDGTAAHGVLPLAAQIDALVERMDQARVAEGIESVGQTIVAGAAVNTPVLCRVRRRITEHGAEDVDAPAR